MSPDTRLVACSHVSWHTGRVVDTQGLAASGAPVLLDGAQGLGAVPVDVGALGCEYYAASGQKWLCGPIGSGYLYVRRDLVEDLAPLAPGYGSLTDPVRALELPLRDGAGRFDSGLPPSHHLAWALAALDTLEEAGFDAVLRRGPELAARLADLLAERGLTVAPRGQSTLVSWEARRPSGGVAASARRRLPGAKPPGHALRPGLGGRLVERGGDGGPGGRGGRYFWVMTTMPNTTAATTPANASAISTA